MGRPTAGQRSGGDAATPLRRLSTLDLAEPVEDPWWPARLEPDDERLLRELLGGTRGEGDA
ncbi:hypothetical protein JIX56_42165 [Streptomyces sp. CA-210063]|uniref:hypothetical protein n=1 Tax=Streptomyces sp. CA-210063 TaxID=2801029 RepID=UPI00214AB1B3|nr:hypothetical protein [Streptomyces sp. CA-210063]UUU35914.1 hypothetical protein JIX56_42165 [Streptomyces sp. CA-210063]